MAESSLAKEYCIGGLYFLKDLNNLMIQVWKKKCNRLRTKTLQKAYWMSTGLLETLTEKVKNRLGKEFRFQGCVIYLANEEHCHICYLIKSSKESSEFAIVVILMQMTNWDWESNNLFRITVRKYQKDRLSDNRALTPFYFRWFSQI